MSTVTISRDAAMVLVASGDLAEKMARKLGMPQDGPSEYRLLVEALAEARAALEVPA
jgi:hypothetical protein